jgi:hypothetical protein
MNVSSGISNGFGPPPPALFTRIVSEPKLFSAVSTSAARRFVGHIARDADRTRRRSHATPIARDADRPAALLPDGAGHLLRRYQLQIANNNRGAGRSKELRDGFADPGAPAGDDRHLVFQSEHFDRFHVSSPTRRLQMVVTGLPIHQKQPASTHERVV